MVEIIRICSKCGRPGPTEKMSMDEFMKKRRTGENQEYTCPECEHRKHFLHGKIPGARWL